MAEADPVAVAGFRVEHRLGRGGMGVVYRAIHLASGEPVALKVMHASDSDDHLDEFAREVRAIAALDHVHVAPVLDYGVERGAGGGRPWVAMGLFPGTIRDRMQAASADWELVREILVQLLGALAHAHGRDLVHRDIKPTNVLWDGAVRLADFGLAHQWREEALDEQRARSGTPSYMAPEQVLGDPARIGPWTDLYAVGCLGWSLVTGDTPFKRPNALLVARAQVRELPGRFEPRFAVPPGVESWLRGLLQKSVSRRPQSAAEALHDLPDPAVGTRPAVAGPVEVGDAPTRTAGVDVSPAAISEGLSHGPVVARPFVVPPPWAGPARDRAASLHGAGLGLFALRRPPVVARDAVKDRLWQALSEVSADREARAVLLTGASGTGKSALARWFVETAAERAGSAGIAFDSRRAGADLVSRAIRFALGGGGMGADEARVRIAERMGALRVEEQEAVARLLEPGAIPKLSERVAAVALAAKGLAARAPAVVWLDDVHDSEELLAILEGLVTVKVPAVVVATARDDAADERARVALRLRVLAAHPRAVRIPIAPLAREHTERALDALLPLDPPTRRALARRTHGNPLHGAMLLADLVERGALVLRPEGFAIADGARASIQGDLRETWARRVDGLSEAGARDLLRAMAVIEEGATPAMLVALLGGAVDVEVVRRILTDASRRGLVTESADGAWSLALGPLRELLLDEIGPEALAALHRAAARVLQGAGARRHAIGVHLIAAGEPIPALRELVEDGGPLFNEFRPLQLHDLADDVARAADAAALPEGNPWWWHVHHWRGMAYLASMEFDAARQALERALACTTDPVRRGVSLRSLSWVYSDRWDFERGTALLREAIDAFGDSDKRWPGVLDLAMVLAQRPTLDEADALLDGAQQALERVGDPILAGRFDQVMSRVYAIRGEIPAAIACLEAAIGRYADVGMRERVAVCMGQIGELHRARGDLEAAEHWYGMAERAHAALMPSMDGLILRFNLLLTRFELGRTDGLEAGAEALLADAAGHPAVILGLHLLLAVVAERADARARHRRAGWKGLQDASLPQRDFGLLAEAVARQGTGGTGPGPSWFACAAWHWRGAGFPDRAELCARDAGPDARWQPRSAAR